MKSLSRDEVRSVDERAIREYGMQSLVLMENAGGRAAAIIHQLAPSGTIVLLCGLGNNGGDGFVIARHLELLRGEKPIVMLLSGAATLDSAKRKMSAEALSNFEILERSGFEIENLEHAGDDLADRLRFAGAIVDAMLGTGAKPGVREPMKSGVQLANQMKAMRIAIDTPTGLDCDTGDISETCFHADYTLTFVSTKLGFHLGAGLKYVGNVHVIDIGVPLDLLIKIQGAKSIQVGA